MVLIKKNECNLVPKSLLALDELVYIGISCVFFCEYLTCVKIVDSVLVCVFSWWTFLWMWKLWFGYQNLFALWIIWFILAVCVFFQVYLLLLYRLVDSDSLFLAGWSPILGDRRVITGGFVSFTDERVFNGACYVNGKNK